MYLALSESVYGHTFIRNVYDQEPQEVRSLVYLSSETNELNGYLRGFSIFL